MATIIPFNGILYNPLKVDASSVMAPPYDIVTPEHKEALYTRSPWNIIRVDFGKDLDDDNERENRYTRAARYIPDWLREGVFIHDRTPALYGYEISYQLGGEQKLMRGFFCAVRIEALGSGCIHPHEMTYSKPKSDRLNILRYCRANTSPVFSLYSSDAKTASSILRETAALSPCIESVNGDGFEHRLWRIEDEAAIRAIQSEMKDRDIFIADGHHRYETALAFKKEMEEQGMSRTGEEPFHYTLMFLSNMEDEGLSLLPTHRIVEIDSAIHVKEVLKKYFRVQKIAGDRIISGEAMQKMIENMKGKPMTFGLFLTNTGAFYTLSYQGSDVDLSLPECLRTLDVTVLHRFIFENLLKVKHYEYEMDPAVAVERAKRGSFEAVFFLNPTRIQDVRAVALAGQRMPPKSTYFFPKLLTGMVIYKF